MKNILIGNGINIQFGGPAYSSEFIMKRIKYNSRLDHYDALFKNNLKGVEIEKVLGSFVDIANDISNGLYDCVTNETDVIEAINDFKKRYTNSLSYPHQIMIEDWFLIVTLFFKKNIDIEDHRTAAIQGFEQLILDSIYNAGKIQEVYKKMNKKVKRFFIGYDNIFTLNYDNNIESLVKKEVYHLHGDFSVLSNSENDKNVLGYIRTCTGKTVWIPEMKHCFCNALLNYSGKLKYSTAQNMHKLIVDSAHYIDRYTNDMSFRNSVEELKNTNPFLAEQILTKIKYPQLNMATEYHFNDFENIQDELHIIGMSPNNDDHIFKLIQNNNKLNKIVFYYYNQDEMEFIKNNYPADFFECMDVNSLWKTLDADKKTFNCNYSVPQKIDDIISVLNIFSDDNVDTVTVLKKLNQIPEYEMERLCKLVKDDISKRNPNHTSTNEKDFRQQLASISYIALQEGILPTVLYTICVMRFQKYIKDDM